MALNAKIKSLVKKAMVILDDLAVSITYTRVVVGAYNAATDGQTVTNTVLTNVKAVALSLTEEDLEWWPANMKGRKFLVAYNDLPITPTDDDYITYNGKDWQIYKTKAVPGESLHIFWVREP